MLRKNVKQSMLTTAASKWRSWIVDAAFASRSFAVPRLSLLTGCVIFAVIAGVVFRFYGLPQTLGPDVHATTARVGFALTGDRIGQTAAVIRVALTEAERSIVGPGMREPVSTFTALIGLAALPCMYWLCIELFASKQAAWIGVALLALSPAAVVFSRTAPQPATLGVAVLVLAATCLRALRLQTKRAWTTYALALAVGLALFPVAAATAMGNLLAVAVTRRENRHDLRAAVSATFAGCAGLLPWAFLFFARLERSADSIGGLLAATPSGAAIIAQIGASTALDFAGWGQAGHLPGLALSLACAALVSYAFFRLTRLAYPRTLLFILFTTVAGVLPPIAADILLGTNFTADSRSFVPLDIGIDLALAYLFASTLKPARIGYASRRAWHAIFVAVIVARAASCAHVFLAPAHMTGCGDCTVSQTVSQRR